MQYTVSYVLKSYNFHLGDLELINIIPILNQTAIVQIWIN